MTFFRLCMVVFGKWYVFKCFSPYIKPLMVSWSPFFILHRLRSFRTCSVGWHSFIVRSISSFPTFFPGKLAISVLRCSKVRFGWPICLKTLLSQSSISIESKKKRQISIMTDNSTTACKNLPKYCSEYSCSIFFFFMPNYSLSTAVFLGSNSEKHLRSN